MCILLLMFVCILSGYPGTRVDMQDIRHGNASGGARTSRDKRTQVSTMHPSDPGRTTEQGHLQAERGHGVVQPTVGEMLTVSR